jgi:hypothetical protein
MQNDKNNYNQFLALVYAPPVYLNEMSANEIRQAIHNITMVLEVSPDFTIEEKSQLMKYQHSYAMRLKILTQTKNL